MENVINVIYQCTHLHTHKRSTAQLKHTHTPHVWRCGVANGILKTAFFPEHFRSIYANIFLLAETCDVYLIIGTDGHNPEHTWKIMCFWWKYLYGNKDFPDYP